MSVISVVKDFDSLSLILVAGFDAPIERVWQLWADPRQLERWWGPGPGRAARSRNGRPGHDEGCPDPELGMRPGKGVARGTRLIRGAQSGRAGLGGGSAVRRWG